MEADQPSTECSARSRLGWIYVIILSAAVVGLWSFPYLWYRPHAKGQSRLWLRERSQIEGWIFHRIPVTERAERLLIADKHFSGVFTNLQTGVPVQVFSAKRYSQRSDETGLFMHTPDRCWSDVGWEIDVISPDSLELEVHGVQMQFERRLFVHDTQRELVYFGGLVGGMPVPYRLNHNLSVGMRRALREAAGKKESIVRATDTRFWARIWKGFVDRDPVMGPKQFIRLSTSCSGQDLSEQDRLLRDFLSLWLEPSDYEAVIETWRSELGREREQWRPSRGADSSQG